MAIISCGQLSLNILCLKKTLGGHPSNSDNREVQKAKSETVTVVISGIFNGQLFTVLVLSA